MNQAQPALRFADFFQANAELVNEILARLGGLQFAMVGEWRCSAAQ